MTFWGGSGSGSADPCLWPMDPDPDPAIFVIDLQDASKKLIFLHNFFCLLLLKLHLYHFSKIKSQKESQNSRNQGFSYYFCMMIEGSGSGSIPLTSRSGFGSRRPKNMWIRWIRIRIRIHNTELQTQSHSHPNILPTHPLPSADTRTVQCHVLQFGDFSGTTNLRRVHLLGRRLLF